jgi:hypothetical protein
MTVKAGALSASVLPNRSPRATRIRIAVQNPSGVVLTDETYDSLPSWITVATGGLATVERL